MVALFTLIVMIGLIFGMLYVMPRDQIVSRYNLLDRSVCKRLASGKWISSESRAKIPGSTARIGEMIEYVFTDDDIVKVQYFSEPNRWFVIVEDGAPHILNGKLAIKAVEKGLSKRINAGGIGGMIGNDL